ncbi:MAG: tetratricopeptide repeat protein [Bryobacterales bacterium]|nr:tetratricopeptide repeat protein [Bryobacterales bacterium]
MARRVVCVLGIAFCSLAPGQVASPSTSKAMDAAMAAFQEGRFAEAETHLRDVVTMLPSDAHAWMVLGVVYAAQGRHELASEPFTRACELNAKEPDACYYLARNHYLRNRFTEALALFDELGRSARRDWRYLNGRGLALSGLGRYSEAEQAFQQAMSYERGGASLDEKPAVNLGSLHLRAGQPEKALAVLRTVTSAFPKAARAWFEQGKAELQLEELDAAVASLNRAVAARPRYPEAHLLLAKIHARRGESEKAVAHRRLAGIP